MLLKNITDKELDDFLINNKQAHFMQTSAFGDVSLKRNYKPLYLGFFDEEKIIASALLLEKRIGPYKTYYCPCGFVADFNDKELLKEIIKQLKEYVKNKNGLYLKINPALIIRKLDENAFPIYTDEYNLSLIDFFKENGGRHRGFTTKFTESSAPRFTFRVDVSKSKEDIFNSLHNTTKKIIKENNPYHITIKKNSENALDKFYEVMKETSLRKKLFVEDYDYFKNFYEKLFAKEKADIYVASVNIDELKEIFKKKLEDVDAEIENIKAKAHNQKNENKLNDLASKRNKILKHKEEIDNIDKKEVILSSIITAKFGETVWTIHGGNSDALPFLNGNYELYYHILLDSKDNGYKYVDFYGSEGKVDKNSPIYGIYLFKLRFGGKFIEFIGEFDFIIKPIANYIINKLLRIRRRILYKNSLK